MNTPNFRQLYAQLDLQPGCTLDELRHAYRQRMMQLHPDKQTAPGSQADAGTPASDLNFIYASAIRFHREHGRLPGGRSPASTDQGSGREREARRPSRPEPATGKMNATPSQEEGPTLRRGPMLLVLLLLSALALAIFLDAMPDPAPEPTGFFSEGK